MQVEPREKKETVKLDRIANDINDKFREAVNLAGESARAGNAAVRAAVACGKLLNQAKDILKNEKRWGRWMLDNCGNIHQTTANRWMRLASQAHVLDLDSCKSVRQAYIACGIIPEPTKPTAGAIGTGEVDIIEVFNGQVQQRIHRVCSYIDQVKVEDMPEAQRIRLKEALKPLIELIEKL